MGSFIALYGVANTRRLVDDPSAALAPMVPAFLGFKGTVRAAGADEYVFTGVHDVDADGRTIHVRELPPRVWTGPYVDALREKLVGDGPDKYVLDIDDVSTTDDVHLILRVRAGVDAAARDLVADLELSRKIALSDLNFWDERGRLRVFDGVDDVMRTHARHRRATYAKRRAHEIRALEHEAALARNRARYVREVHAGQIPTKGCTEAELCALLRARDFYDHENFDYVRRMGVFALTTDRAAQLEAAAVALAADLDRARASTPEDLWKKDLDALVVAHAAYEKGELKKRARADEAPAAAAGPKAKRKKA